MTWVIGHRGAPTEAPENTLEAFEAAIDAGADMIEFDVRRARDGALVVSHDPPRGGEPRLEDVLAAVGGRVRLDVECKEDGYVEEVCALLRGIDDLVVTSFLDAVVKQVGRLLPSARTGLLLGVGRPRGYLRTRRSELFPVERLWRCGADFAAPHLTLARLGALARASAAGYPSLVWTVNEESDLLGLLADPRVAGVITDVPRRAVGLRNAGAPHGL